jgi:hypothetical protein
LRKGYTGAKKVSGQLNRSLIGEDAGNNNGHKAVLFGSQSQKLRWFFGMVNPLTTFCLGLACRVRERTRIVIGETMRSLHIVATLALATAAAVAAPAFAGGSDLSFTVPIGFSSGGEHKGLETFTHTTTTNGATSMTTEKLPGGWDEGKAAWKAPLQSSNPVLTTSPVGHGHR